LPILSRGSSVACQANGGVLRASSTWVHGTGSAASRSSPSTLRLECRPRISRPHARSSTHVIPRPSSTGSQRRSSGRTSSIRSCALKSGRQHGHSFAFRPAQEALDRLKWQLVPRRRAEACDREGDERQLRLCLRPPRPGRTSRPGVVAGAVLGRSRPACGDLAVRGFAGRACVARLCHRSRDLPARRLWNCPRRGATSHATEHCEVEGPCSSV
jgi:hypothetical protein